MTIIWVYALITDAEEEEIDEFYDQIQLENDRTWKQNMLLVIGDCSAKVGNIKKENVVGLHGLKIWNKTGDRLN